jgi:hypothetical protein
LAEASTSLNANITPTQNITNVNGQAANHSP